MGQQLRLCLWGLAASTLLAGRISAVEARPSASAPGFTPARFWAGGIASAPRIPLLGDADGDGRADLLVCYPPENGIVDYVRTSPLGKPCFPVQARQGFGKDTLAAVCGSFTEPGKAAVLVVLADGSVRVLHSLKPGSDVFAQDDLAASLPLRVLPKAPVQAVSGDFDGDGKCDALLVGAEGRPLLLQNAGGEAIHFLPRPISGRLPRLRRIAAGDLDGNGRAEIVWITPKGDVFRAGVEADAAGRQRWSHLARLLRASPEEEIAVGRFRGAKAADILIGERLLTGGDLTQIATLSGLPSRKQARGDLIWLAADLDGDGRDDLVRVRRSGEPFIGDDILVHFSGAENNALLDSDNDGLPDAWETGAIKPGGLDLPALGCKPGRRDLIVEVQPFADVPQDPMRAQMAKVVQYFAALPIANPDGSTGCALHLLYRDPIPIAEKNRSWWELGDRYHPGSHRGITHWMEIYNGGGGQSGEMTDRGGCGAHALYATFLHEFGHQLGLGHTGGWAPAWCPTYPSVMNYAYNYQRNGRIEEIGYSDGRLASVVLNERNLSEKLPLPRDQVAFLAGPPYRYRLQPTPDGKATLIDWNWNGKFGEKHVAADINYGYSTMGGIRESVAKTNTSPVPVTLSVEGKERLLLFCGQFPETPLPPDAATKPSGSASERPVRLCMSLWQGEDPVRQAADWSGEFPVEADGLTGDPSAARFGEVAWVAYPTTKGVLLRRVTLDAQGRPMAGPSTTVPQTLGCQATLIPLAGKLALLLWRDAKTPLELRWLDVSGEAVRVGKAQALSFTSNGPVGAAEGAAEKGLPTLWIGLTQDQAAARPSRWQVRRFALQREGTLRQQSQEWVGGEDGGVYGSGRLMLLWEPNRTLGKQGQLYFFGGGLQSEQVTSTCHYIAMRIADKHINQGWLTRRYYDEWTISHSAPGVCFFQGDIFLAARWYGSAKSTKNDPFYIAFFGRGIESEPMGDFDDIGFIRDVGIGHSIAYIKR